MHVAVTGVSGFIGSFLARTLRREGHTVTGLVRETSRRDHIEPDVDRFVVGDHADESIWADFLDGADGVIHNSVDWAPLKAEPVELDTHLKSNLDASIKLLHAAAPRRFVFISTIAVHHDMRPRWGGEIEEDHPLRPSMLYGAYKAAVEAHLWDAHFRMGMHTAAVRPCGVYGLDPDRSRAHGYELLRKVNEGHAVIKPGGGKFVHVADVADATVAALTRDNAAGRPYNLVDCYARWGDWGAMANQVLGQDVDVNLDSPAEPKNHFLKDATQNDLGVAMDRGHAGIRRHLEELAGVMREAGELTAAAGAGAGE